MEPVNSDKSTKCFLLVPFLGENVPYSNNIIRLVSIIYAFVFEEAGLWLKYAAVYTDDAAHDMCRRIYFNTCCFYIDIHICCVGSQQTVGNHSIISISCVGCCGCLAGQFSNNFPTLKLFVGTRNSNRSKNGDNHTDIHYTLIRQNEASQRIRVEKVDIHGQQQRESNAIAHLLWSCWYLLRFGIKSETNKWKK